MRSPIELCVNSLTTKDGRIVFNSIQAAKAFGESFLKLQNGHWGSQKTVMQYYLLSRAIKAALNEGVIELVDLDADDQFVMAKLDASNSKEIKRYIGLLNDQSPIKVNGQKEEGSVFVTKKFRYVDPLYLDNGQLKMLSENDPEYKKLVERAEHPTSRV